MTNSLIDRLSLKPWSFSKKEKILNELTENNLKAFFNLSNSFKLINKPGTTYLNLCLKGKYLLCTMVDKKILDFILNIKL